MTRATSILSWYDDLKLNVDLPENIRVLNPYADMSANTRSALETFYHRFYGDENPRGIIMGINPGRLGAGVTGIPFTDTPALESIGISNPDVQSTETSADYVWNVIEAFGGPDRFFGKYFIGAVSPLGFIQKNDKGNWVNFNYYDTPEVMELLTPFIVQQVQLQKELCGNPSVAYLLGTGQNAKAMNKLNDQHHFYEKIIALEHPRFIMQYRRKRMDEFIEKFVNIL